MLIAGPFLRTVVPFLTMHVRDVIQDHGSAEPMVYAVRFNILLHVDL